MGPLGRERPDTYGADRKWVLLKPVPVELDDEEMGEAAGSSANA